MSLVGFEPSNHFGSLLLVVHGLSTAMPWEGQLSLL